MYIAKLVCIRGGIKFNGQLSKETEENYHSYLKQLSPTGKAEINKQEINNKLVGLTADGVPETIASDSQATPLRSKGH